MKKFTALLFSMILAFSLASCGNRQDSEIGNTSSLVYVPEYLELGDEGESFLEYDALLDGDMLCHPVLSREEGTAVSQIVLHRHSLTNDTLVEFPLKDGAAGIYVWTLGADGSMYFVLFGWSCEEAEAVDSASTVLVKYGRTGSMVFWRDITELLPGEDSYRMRITADSQGRTYLLTERGILLFDGKGNPRGMVNVAFSGSLYSGCFGRGSDGKVYLSGTVNNGPNDDSTLYEVDFETEKLGAGLADFPSEGNSLTQDAVGNVVTYDGTAVYTYDLNTQEKEQLFAWTDSGIDSTAVTTVGVLSDGRIAVFYRDWQENVSGVALLSGVDVAEVVPKQEIVVTQLYPNPALSSAATAFNRESDKYHITVKNLVSFNASQEEAEAAKTRLAADIIAGNGPDVLNPLSLEAEVEALVSMGAFEDLNSYLDKSSILAREDMVESALGAGTFDGILVSIPLSFDVYAYFGSSARVGEEMGWTHEDVITLLKENPGSTLTDNMGRAGTLFFCMDFNDFIDWETGTCSFDSEEFKSLLEFAAQVYIPEENAYDVGGRSLVTEKIRSGEILLEFSSVSSFPAIQRLQELFQGDVTAIGIPTSDGSAYCSLSIQEAVAMLSQSEVKDGAWEFIEFYLTNVEDRYLSGMPNSWSKLEEEIALASKCALDNFGNPMTEANGDPIPAIQYEYDMGDYRFKTHILTQEEIDQVKEIIRAGKRIKIGLSTDEEMLRNIITEEAEAFFQGQKSVDEVADIIQRRVSVYVSENS